MFLDCNFYFFDKEYDDLFVEIGADAANSFNIAANKLEIDLVLHFLERFVKASHLSKSIEFLEIKLGECSFAWKGIYFLAVDLLENHVVGVVSLEGRLG